MQLSAKTNEARHELPPLPYRIDALEPYMSRETLMYHYSKHHRAYVNKLNAILAGSEYEGASLEDVIRQAAGPLFNNAAQVWNHNFFWRCLAPGGSVPTGELLKRIVTTFGSLDAFRNLFMQCALDKFGSGWTWLVESRTGQLLVYNTDDANNPMRIGNNALLACDVWEHAYYIDYRNDRARYLNAFWALVDWKFAAENLRK